MQDGLSEAGKLSRFDPQIVEQAGEEEEADDPADRGDHDLPEQAEGDEGGRVRFVAEQEQEPHLRGAEAGGGNGKRAED